MWRTIQILMVMVPSLLVFEFQLQRSDLVLWPGLGLLTVIAGICHYRMEKAAKARAMKGQSGNNRALIVFSLLSLGMGAGCGLFYNLQWRSLAAAVASWALMIATSIVSEFADEKRVSSPEARLPSR